MNNQQVSDAFLAKVRDAYQSSHPVFLELMQEQKQLKTYLAMLKVSVEINSGDEGSGFIDMLDQIIQHFDKMSSIVAVHDGLAMMVNAVTVEHEVEW